MVCFLCTVKYSTKLNFKNNDSAVKLQGHLHQALRSLDGPCPSPKLWTHVELDNGFYNALPAERPKPVVFQEKRRVRVVYHLQVSACSLLYGNADGPHIIARVNGTNTRPAHINSHDIHGAGSVQAPQMSRSAKAQQQHRQRHSGTSADLLFKHLHCKKLKYNITNKKHCPLAHTTYAVADAPRTNHGGQVAATTCHICALGII